MELGARVGGDPGTGDAGEDVVAVELDGAGKVVAVEAHAHGEAGLDGGAAGAVDGV